ncbi:hypothetical protein [Bifidobacterium sp. ESL0790]|uniref:hypothetical protein n=1 Tax=Bifidobacterium sp. ESL0790 TaxID=2983233 RepID=UPI0023FA4543|nr:hypothetical protein [Bifidobacterium sp. ESL0790]WEV72206.1 hypothetical protein OZY47_07160 [Bifidobacterium sp. ESL0790]
MHIRTMYDVGMALKRGREADGVTQQLADKSCVSRNWIAKVETGKGSFDMYKVLQTFVALNMPLSVDFLDEDGESQGH